MHVSVNASAVDLLDLRFPDEVAAALAAHQVPASALVIELTESSVTSVPSASATWMRVVGEGVEDEDTWQLLEDLECEAIQSYFLARPMPAAEFEAFLAGAAPRAELEAGRVS